MAKKQTPKKPSRAGGPGRAAKRSPTAAKVRAARRATADTERRPTFEVWGTIAYGKGDGGTPSVCLWGHQQTAIDGCEYDECVCLVRVEVLEVLD